MSERGSMSIVAVCGALVLCLTALGVADLGAMLFARAAAQTAAEAAALAAAQRLVPILGQGGSPEDAAREEAEGNGARLVWCSCEEGSLSASVEVRVTARASFVTPWFGRDARATARAEVDPDVLSYRDTG